MITFLSLLLGFTPPLPTPMGPTGAASVTDAVATASAAGAAGAVRAQAVTGATHAPALADTTSAEDRWFAEDKLQHFFMSFAATSLAYGGVRSVGLENGPGLAAAGGAAVTLGLGKEWYDRRAGGPFSLRDLAWDAAGIVAALVIAAQTR